MKTLIIVLFLLAAGAMDLKENRISNWWVGVCFITGIWISWRFPQDIKPVYALIGYLSRCLWMLILLFPIFKARMMGAGDIKMMALIVGYLGVCQGGKALLVSFAAGAVWSLAKLLYHRNLWKRISYLFAYIRQITITKEITPYYIPERDGRTVTIPFGFCLALGTIAEILSKYIGGKGL